MRRTSGPRIPFTDEMRAHVTNLRETTGWGATSISKRITAKKLPGHKYATLGRVLVIVNAQKIKTVDQALYESIISVLENLDAEESNLFGRGKCQKRVILDEHFLSKLEALMAQYQQLSITKALRLLGAPSDLNANIVSRALNRNQNSLKSEHYKFLESRFKELRKNKH